MITKKIENDIEKLVEKVKEHPTLQIDLMLRDSDTGQVVHASVHDDEFELFLTLALQTFDLAEKLGTDTETILSMLKQSSKWRNEKGYRVEGEGKKYERQ